MGKNIHTSYNYHTYLCWSDFNYGSRGPARPSPALATDSKVQDATLGRQTSCSLLPPAPPSILASDPLAAPSPQQTVFYVKGSPVAVWDPCLSHHGALAGCMGCHPRRHGRLCSAGTWRSRPTDDAGEALAVPEALAVAQRSSHIALTPLLLQPSSLLPALCPDPLPGRSTHARWCRCAPGGSWPSGSPFFPLALLCVRVAAVPLHLSPLSCPPPPAPPLPVAMTEHLGVQWRVRRGHGWQELRGDCQ